MNDVLALYEETQRKNIHYHDMRTEHTPDVTRLIAEKIGEGAVIYSRLDESNADRVICEQIAYFEEIGQDFEWKVFDYDRPADLRERLMASSFECEEPESIMALDLESATASLFERGDADVRRITDPAQIVTAMQILEQVWNDSHAILGKILTEEFTHNGAYLSMYLAYADGIPASAAWIRFHEGNPFAGLWGGSSLPAYRKRGLYTALLSVRAQEARQRGVRYLTIDASPMSQPIVAKYGFQVLTTAYALKYSVKKPQS